MGRKYKQEGYQDVATEKGNSASKKHPKRTGEGPRSPRMPGFQEVMRCAMCGNIISSNAEIRFDSQCAKCQSDLRTCKHCRHFDTAAQFECTQPIPKRVAKDIRTDCSYFDPRTSVERETTSPSVKGNESPRDARSAFDDLFR